MRDTANNTTTLLSQNSSGTVADSGAIGLDVSSDGRFVLFYSGATNLGPAVTNTGYNLYMLDRATDTFTILNKKYDGSLLNMTWAPYGHMSCDGSLVVFQSAPNLTTTYSSHVDTYLLDRRSGDRLTDLTASANAAAIGPNISCNGDYVGLASMATNLDTSTTVPAGYYHAYVYDRVNSSFSIVDRPASGSFQSISLLPYTANGGERYMQLSDNGSAAFQSTATNLISSGTTSGRMHAYVRYMSNGTTDLLTRDSGANEANSDSSLPAIDAKGSLAAYQSNATNLVSNDTNGYADVFTSQTGL